MEELKRFQGSAFDTKSRRKLVEDRDTILEQARFRNEANCMNDSSDFQDAESVRSGQWPPGLHTTTRELQTKTFESRRFNHTTKIPREDPQREKKSEMGAGEGKKREISGGQAEGVPGRGCPVEEKKKPKHLKNN